MPYAHAAAISLVEAAYDVNCKRDEWFPGVVRAAGALLDEGFGVMGALGRQVAPGTLPEVTDVCGPKELLAMQASILAEMPDEAIGEGTQTGVLVVSEANADRPDYLEILRRHLRTLGADDAVGVTGVDPHGLGVHLFAPIAARSPLSAPERTHWRMLTAHLSAGQRLHQKLRATPDGSARGDDLPHGADAVIDPKNFAVQEMASGELGDAVEGTLREAAIRVDKVRARRSQEESNDLASWEALVRGRWSMLDWFDTDDRRYILAVPNAPEVVDPRGLTKRESQVAAYAAIGESHKLIAYRLGISRGRVTNHLSSVMKKLGITKQAQLVERLRGLLYGAELD